MTERRLRFLRLKWTAIGAIGAMIGGGLAVSLFPELGFNQRRFDQFSEEHVLFALMIGMFFALAQSSFLFRLLRESTATKSLFFGWALISSVGFASLLAPLWYSDPLLVIWYGDPLWLFASAVFLYSVLVLMLPGMAILALGQCYLLQETLSVGLGWIIRTMIGVAIGALLAGPAFITLVSTLDPVVEVFGDALIDATLAAVIGASIGALQGGALKKTLKNAPSLQKNL